MREYIVRVDNNKFTIEGEIVRCKECRNRYTQQRCAGRHPNWFCAAGAKQITGKSESAENATSEGDGSTMGQPKSKLYIPLNQHTVERINRLHKNDCGDYFDEEWLYNELEQIAEILQPPVTPTVSEDCISRDWIINYCNSKVEHYRQRIKRIEKEGESITYDPGTQIEHFKDEIAIYESFAREMQNAPSVIPTERTGEWIEHKYAEEYDGLMQSNFECSKCHDWLREQTNYCPNCGARMDKGGDTE